jgi:hypothetical protein
MSSSDCLDLPGLWNKKLGVLESPGSLFTCVSPLTIITLTAGCRRRQRNGFRQWLEAWLFRRKSLIINWRIIANALIEFLKNPPFWMFSEKRMCSQVAGFSGYIGDMGEPRGVGLNPCPVSEQCRVLSGREKRT